MIKVEWFIRSFILLLFFPSISGCIPGGEREKATRPAREGTPPKADPKWLGEWERNEWMSEAKLTIKAIEADRFDFSLFASSGAHNGDLAGVAIAKTNSAVFQQSEGDGRQCILEFELLGDSLIKVQQKEGICDAGMGVHYTGEYKNTKYKSGKKEEPKTLSDLGVFENRMQDSLFRALVKDQYDLFLNSTQFTSQNDDLDSVNATVNASGVRGLSRFLENIIMINPEGKIWAAVIDDDKVLYFTNQKEYAERLPFTIEAWRFDFQQYPVIFKSKNFSR